MSADSERLHELVGEVVKTDPVVNLAINSHRSAPHLTPVLFAPNIGLTEVYFFSPLKSSLSRDILRNKKEHGVVWASGISQVPQNPRDPRTSISFEGRIEALSTRPEIKKALGAFTTNGVLAADELETEVEAPWGRSMRTPNAYAALVSVWHIHDETLIGSRATTLAWPQL